MPFVYLSVSCLAILDKRVLVMMVTAVDRAPGRTLYLESHHSLSLFYVFEYLYIKAKTARWRKRRRRQRWRLTLAYRVMVAAAIA